MTVDLLTSLLYESRVMCMTVDLLTSLSYESTVMCMTVECGPTHITVI